MNDSADGVLFRASVYIEFLGVILMSAGLGYEIAMREPIGYIIFGAGGTLLVIGSFLTVKARRIWDR